MQDVWQFGILIYVLLTGLLPWQKADLTDPHYAEYLNWRKRRTLRTPKRLSNFTTRFLRLLKRMLEPKPEKRASIKEVLKYIDDKWLVKLVKRDENDVDNQSICYSTYSMHSSKFEKDKVLKALKDHGIETTVDRAAKRKRIHEWLERSISSRPVVVDEEEATATKDNCREKISSHNNSNSLSSHEPVNGLKSSNRVSRNNLTDDGYQTGSSSNNSSIRTAQLSCNLGKSSGNINIVNGKKVVSIQPQLLGLKNLDKSSDDLISLEDPLTELGSQQYQCSNQKNITIQRNLPNSTDQSYRKSVINMQNVSTKAPNSSAQHSFNSAHHSQLHSKDPSLLVKEHNQYINMHQIRGVHNHSSSATSKQSTPNQNTVTISQNTAAISATNQHQQQAVHNAGSYTPQGGHCIPSPSTAQQNESSTRQRPWESSTYYKTDSQHFPSSPQTISISRQASEECLSEGSVDSVILKMNSVGA